MEEYGFVLDYLPEGRPTAPIKRMMEPLAYIIGKDEYRLFEVSVKKDVEIGEMTYIGKT
jgi:Predicted RNA-binding protein